jgi:hypothetical protein
MLREVLPVRQTGSDITDAVPLDAQHTLKHPHLRVQLLTIVILKPNSAILLISRHQMSGQHHDIKRANSCLKLC